MKKKIDRKSLIRLWTAAAVLAVLFLFSFLSMNLKSVDYGYEMQELARKEKALKEELNQLKAQKASLLNLERVEDIVMNKLGYRYPEPEQFIKVFEE